MIFIVIESNDPEHSVDFGSKLMSLLLQRNHHCRDINIIRRGDYFVSRYAAELPTESRHLLLECDYAKHTKNVHDKLSSGGDHSVLICVNHFQILPGRFKTSDVHPNIVFYLYQNHENEAQSFIDFTNYQTMDDGITIPIGENSVERMYDHVCSYAKSRTTSSSSTAIVPMIKPQTSGGKKYLLEARV